MGEPIKLQRGDEVVVVYGPNHAQQLATEGWKPATTVVETEPETPTELGDQEDTETEETLTTEKAPATNKSTKAKKAVKGESASSG